MQVCWVLLANTCLLLRLLYFRYCRRYKMHYFPLLERNVAQLFFFLYIDRCMPLRTRNIKSYLIIAKINHIIFELIQVLLNRHQCAQTTFKLLWSWLVVIVKMKVQESHIIMFSILTVQPQF